MSDANQIDYREFMMTSADGRALEVATVGDPGGRTVFFHHGTPGSAPLLRSLAPLAERADLFLVTASRPGYGRSARRAGRSIADQVDDVTTVLDQLGRSRYASLGWSGGGPHALACAALDAARCAGAWSLAGVVPIDAGFDWTEGMGPENLEEFRLALEGGEAYEQHMREAGEQFATASAHNLIALFGGLFSDVDCAALAEESAREILATSCRQAFAVGTWGFYDDDRAFFAPWGFDPADLAVPVSVWYGDQDLMVPATHGDWLGAHIPGVRVHHLANEGHVSLISNHLEELADEIAGVVDSL